MTWIRAIRDPLPGRPYGVIAHTSAPISYPCFTLMAARMRTRGGRLSGSVERAYDQQVAVGLDRFGRTVCGNVGVESREPLGALLVGEVLVHGDFPQLDAFGVLGEATSCEEHQYEIATRLREHEAFRLVMQVADDGSGRVAKATFGAAPALLWCSSSWRSLSRGSRRPGRVATENPVWLLSGGSSRPMGRVRPPVCTH